MGANEILRELLEQHEELRLLLGDAAAYAERCSRGDGEWGTLRGWLATAADAVHAHNRDEERLLGKLLPSLDGWVQRGGAFMEDEHVREHAELHTAFVRAAEDDDITRAGDVALALIARIKAHMTAEERVFLRPDVLCDPPEASG